MDFCKNLELVTIKAKLVVFFYFTFDESSRPSPIVGGDWANKFSTLSNFRLPHIPQLEWRGRLIMEHFSHTHRSILFGWVSTPITVQSSSADSELRSWGSFLGLLQRAHKVASDALRRVHSEHVHPSELSVCEGSSLATDWFVVEGLEKISIIRCWSAWRGLTSWSGRWKLRSWNVLNVRPCWSFALPLVTYSHVKRNIKLLARRNFDRST